MTSAGEPAAGGEAQPAAGPPSLTAQTLTGLRWAYLSAAAVTVMQVVYTAVMGRLVLPEAYGIVAMATTAMGLAAPLSAAGVNAAVVQRGQVDERDVRVAFTLSLVLGAAGTALVWALAPLVAGVFAEPALTGVLRLMSLAILLGSAGMSADGVLRRRMAFRTLARLDVITNAVAFLGVGIGLAAAGAGVWSLAVAALVSPAVASALLLRHARHPLRLLWDWVRVRSLWSYSSRASLVLALQFAADNIDYFFVGRYAGARSLGFYTRAFLLVNLPLRYASQTLTRVLFPSFSRTSQDRPRLGRAFLDLLPVTALLLFPVCAGLAVAAREAILVLLGPRWLPAAAVLPVLTVAGAFNTLSHLAGSLLEAVAELNRRVALELAGLPLLVGALALVAGGPLWHYAAALVAVEALRLLGFVFALRAALGISLRAVARALGPGLAGVPPVLAATMGARAALAGGALPALVVLLAEISAAGVALALTLRLGPLGSVRGILRARLDASGAARRSPVIGAVAGLLLGPGDRAG